jgi:hypothetical protein
MTIRTSTMMTLRSAYPRLPMNQFLQRQVSVVSGSAFGSGRPTSGVSRETIGSKRILSRGCISRDDATTLLSRSLVTQHNFALSSSFRCFSSSSSDDDKNKNNNLDVVDVDYVSPLGGLISRLKMVSITGCFLSVCVFPALVFLKHGDLPNAQQTTMGTIATLSATGSTAALQFVFGAYVLEMKTIGVVTKNDDNEETNASNETNEPNSRRMLEAKTRSVFGFWKNTHVFDPTKDVEPYQGHRPFANFSANGVPLYVHPDKLDSITRQLLLSSSSKSNTDTETTKETNNNNSNNNTEIRDHEGLATTTTKKKKTKKDDDDEFF